MFRGAPSIASSSLRLPRGAAAWVSLRRVSIAALATANASAISWGRCRRRARSPGRWRSTALNSGCERLAVGTGAVSRLASFDPSLGEADAYGADLSGALDIEELFEEVYAEGPVVGGGELADELGRHAGDTTERLGAARDALKGARAALVEAEASHDAAQAALVAVRAATRPLDGSKSVRLEEFTSGYSRLRKMLGERPLDVAGIWQSKDWGGVLGAAERLVAAAMGVGVASEADPADERADLAWEPSPAAAGPWVSASPLEGLPVSEQTHEIGETALSAWVLLWAREDAESFEVAAGIVDVSSTGALSWCEPLRWTAPGLEWLQRGGLDREQLGAREAEAAGLEL